MGARRRVLVVGLAVLAVSLAGCLGSDTGDLDEQEADEPTSDEPPSEEPAGNGSDAEEPSRDDAREPTDEEDPASGPSVEAPRYDRFEAPDELSQAEPTIGIPWDTDSVFYHSGATTYRVTFDDDGEAAWTDVTPPYQVPYNLDPMLHADPDTGRVWAGGLHGACSVMMYTDDDGETWAPAGNMCSGKDFDHQSIGSGPSTVTGTDVAYPHTQYYCAQFGSISCAVSHDGGQTWGPFVTEETECGGFHGHIRVSRVTGMMAAPVGDCGGQLGMLTTYDGLEYTAKTIPGSEQWTNGFDPSLQFGRDDGTLWYGMASENGLHISKSTDDGDSWETLGGGMDAEASQHLDVGQFHDPPVVSGTFADVQVGEDDRVAFSFMGIQADASEDLSFLTSNQIYQCEARQEELVWNYYVAHTYDGGDTWGVERISSDPVQVGGVYDVVSESSGDCRNLLDFNDMDLDSQGRVHIAWTDGCVDECAETAEPETQGYRATELRLFRQADGPRLFADGQAPSTGTETRVAGGQPAELSIP